MLTSFVIALSVAISFGSTRVTCNHHAVQSPRDAVNVVEEPLAIDIERDRATYVPFIDGFNIPESDLERISRTA